MRPQITWGKKWDNFPQCTGSSNGSVNLKHLLPGRKSVREISLKKKELVPKGWELRPGSALNTSTRIYSFEVVVSSFWMCSGGRGKQENKDAEEGRQEGL